MHPCLQSFTFLSIRSSIDCERRLRITSPRQIWTHSLLCLLRLTGSLLRLPSMGRVLILSPMEAIPCNATCAPPDSLASHGRAYVLGSKPSSPLRGDVTVSPTHALPIIQTALVSPACPPAGIGQQGTSLTGAWLFHQPCFLKSDLTLRMEGTPDSWT